MSGYFVFNALSVSEIVGQLVLCCNTLHDGVTSSTSQKFGKYDNFAL